MRSGDYVKIVGIRESSSRESNQQSSSLRGTSFLGTDYEVTRLIRSRLRMYWVLAVKFSTGGTME